MIGTLLVGVIVGLVLARALDRLEAWQTSVMRDRRTRAAAVVLREARETAQEGQHGGLTSRGLTREQSDRIHDRGE